MLFNSIDFAIFLPIIFILYWLCNKKLNLQNLVVVFASYIFYGWWDYRFLSLILFSTLVDYLVCILLKNESNSSKRKYLLWTSVLINVGFLGVFKYYNFFIDNFVEVFSFFGMSISPSNLNIILPVGISFYTFQTMSYTIDVYKKELQATNDFIAFAAFVSFFPQLVAGPIERATNLLPQFYSKRRFVYANAVDGMRQILWGLFKKVVIADNCAEYANVIFNNYQDYSSCTLFLGALFFTFQIYCDFSGYSDIAIGTSRLFGFNLMRNFSFPYFSRDIAEFWRRWHISLSSWFRDYLYFPLGGSRGGTWMKLRNTFAIFIVSGFWHGANWTFVVWGALNAFYFMPLLLANKNRVNIEIVAYDRWFPSVKELFQIITTFLLTTLSWVFFRADSISHALNYLFSILNFKKEKESVYIDNNLMYLLIFFILIEWLGRNGQYALQKIDYLKIFWIRWFFYVLIIIFILFFSGKQQDFIYFQF